MWFNNLVNSFLTFCALFVVACSIGFRWPHPEIPDLIWGNATSAAITVLVTFGVWVSIGLVTRLDRLLQQPPQTLSSEKAMELAMPIACPAISGLFVTAALYFARLPGLPLDGVFWACVVALGSVSILLILMVMHHENRIGIRPTQTAQN